MMYLQSGNNNFPPNVVEMQYSMSHIYQPQVVHPITRWILEEGQLLGVLVVSTPSGLLNNH